MKSIKLQPVMLDEDANNYGQILIALIRDYTKTSTLVADISKGTYISK